MDSASGIRASQDREIDAAAVAARLREKASELGLSQSELMRRTGTKRQSMADYWAGKRVIGTDRLFPIADALNVSTRWLLYGIDNNYDGFIDNFALDWVWVARHDLTELGPREAGHIDQMIHVDRNWLLRTFGRTDGIWFAEMPSDTLTDIVQRGETLVLEDASSALTEGRHYVFELDGRVVVRRYDVVPGKVVLSGSNPGIVPITVEIGELGKSLRPIAHILGAFSLRSF